MNIVVVGIGYVGLANAILLAQANKVIAVDIVKERVDMINFLNSSSFFHLVHFAPEFDYFLLSTPLG